MRAQHTHWGQVLWNVCRSFCTFRSDWQPQTYLFCQLHNKKGLFRVVSGWNVMRYYWSQLIRSKPFWKSNILFGPRLFSTSIHLSYPMFDMRMTLPSSGTILLEFTMHMVWAFYSQCVWILECPCPLNPPLSPMLLIFVMLLTIWRNVTRQKKKAFSITSPFTRPSIVSELDKITVLLNSLFPIYQSVIVSITGIPLTSLSFENVITCLMNEEGHLHNITPPTSSSSKLDEALAVTPGRGANWWKGNHPNSHLLFSKSPLKLYAINAEELDIFAQLAPLRIQMPWLMLLLKMMKKKPLPLLLMKIKMMEHGKLLSFILCFLLLLYLSSFCHYPL